MKLIFLFILVVITTQSVKATQVSEYVWKCNAQQDLAMSNKTKNALELIAGIFWGFEHAAVPSLDVCIEDILATYDNVEEAIKDFEKQTWEDVLAGIHKLGDALNSLATALKDCGGISEDIEKIIKVFKQFKSPVTFFFEIGKNLLINGKEILAEITAAHQYWCDKNYLYCGQQIGFIVSKLLGTGLQAQRHHMGFEMRGDAPHKLGMPPTKNALGKDIKQPNAYVNKDAKLDSASEFPLHVPVEEIQKFIEASKSRQEPYKIVDKKF